jgi:hypothetical protein
MLNLGRRDALPDPKNPAKPATLGPAPAYGASNSTGAQNTSTVRPSTPGVPPRESSPVAARESSASASSTPASPPASLTPQSLPMASVPDAPPSKLFVGINIKLKGV